MGWQAVYLLAYDLAVSDQPSDLAAEALLACAPDRAAHEAARARYLGARSEPSADGVAPRALSYLEESIRRGDASGRWVSGSPARTGSRSTSLRNGGGKSGSMTVQS